MAFCCQNGVAKAPLGAERHEDVEPLPRQVRCCHCSRPGLLRPGDLQRPPALRQRCAPQPLRRWHPEDAPQGLPALAASPLRPTGRPRSGSGPATRRPLPLPPGPPPQGGAGPADHPPTPPERRTGLCPVLPGDLPHRQTAVWPGQAPPDLPPASAACALLLLSGPRLRPALRPSADLVPLHL